MKRILSVMSRRRLALLAGLSLWALASLASAAASWPSRLNYQGQLTDSSGVAVADGSYNIVFAIYNVASGGVALWSETQNVNVAKGLFNVVLGGVTPISLSSVNLTDDLWVGLNVNSNGEMVPRQQLLSSVYALNANLLQGTQPGTSAYNLVQLDVTGKIPAGLVNGGSVSVPLSLSGSNAGSILSANNSGTGLAVSATTNSSTNPGLWAEGARYGAIVKTNDAALGVALQAQGPGAAYASLVDKVKNAQVYGLAANATAVGVLGENSNGSGTGIAGTGGYIGVSGSGGTYGVYGTSSNTGVNGVSTGGSGVGVLGIGYYGVQGNGTFFGVYANGGTYGLYATGSSYGVYATTSSSSGKGTWSRHTGTGAGAGVSGETTSVATNASGVQGLAQGATGQTYGVRGVNSSNSAASAGVFGSSAATTATGYGVHGEVSPTSYVYPYSAGVHGANNGYYGPGVLGEGKGQYSAGVYGTSLNSAGVGGYNMNYNSAGVSAEGLQGVYASTFADGGAGVYAYTEAWLSPAIYADAWNASLGAQIYADSVGVSATAYYQGVLATANGPTGYGVAGLSSDSSVSGAGTGVYGLTGAINGMGGRFTNTNSSGRGLVGEGGYIGVSASGGTYGVYAEGVDYGVFGKATNSYGVRGEGQYALWGDGQAYGVVAFANAAGGTAVYANSGSGGTGLQVYGNGSGAYGVNSYAGSSGSYGVYANAGGASSWAIYGTASNSNSFGVYGIASGTNGIGVNAEGSASGGRGVLARGNCTTCYGGYFENTVATGAHSGGAIYASGSVFLPTVADTFTVLSGNSSIVVNNAKIHSTDVVLLTSRSAPSPSTVRWWVSSINPGVSFTVSFSALLTANMTFNSLIIGN